jgi:hypothetical protein
MRSYPQIGMVFTSCDVRGFRTSTLAGRTTRYGNSVTTGTVRDTRAGTAAVIDAITTFHHRNVVA